MCVDDEKFWYVYMLCCADGTLYTGMTDRPQQRLSTHNEGKGAKYTRSRRPVSMVYLELCTSRSDALKRECAVKKLSRQQKLALIAANKQESAEPTHQ